MGPPLYEGRVSPPPVCNLLVISAVLQSVALAMKRMARASIERCRGRSSRVGQGEGFRWMGSIELVRAITGAASLFLFLFSVNDAAAQSAPASPKLPWHSPAARQIEDDARKLRDFRPGADPTQSYSLAELIDLAEKPNPETRVAWERAPPHAAALSL